MGPGAGAPRAPRLIRHLVLTLHNTKKCLAKMELNQNCSFLMRAEVKLADFWVTPSLH